MNKSLLSKFVACLAGALLTLSACSKSDAPQAATERMVAPILTGPDAKDIHSFARPEIARVTHVALDLVTDFNAQRIGGTATLDISAKDDADEIVLDSKGLEISSITDGEGRTLQYTLGAADPNLGSPLAVKMGKARKIRITYKSAPDAPALQWLAPEQTAGKRHPFLFSQGQAILNRTWIPTQDSPGIRQTWEARVIVPEPLKVVMSGKALTPEGEAAEGGRAYHFLMNKPVAPYLIAIAAGDIAFREVGPRTGVYAEPSTLEAAANELADTEKMVTAAEELYGPYRWDRYDMIVLPPAFPFGGMENPMMTFLTPTMIAGDRSLVALIAHELAHSWSGNLVTNATWADFWLNEGFTTYFENRIMERMYGKEAAVREALLGWDTLQAEIAAHGGPSSPATALHLDLKGKDPDEGATEIAYEKGAAFLHTIERIVGRKAFDAYLRSYFDRHAFQPMTAERFLADIRKNLVKDDAALEQKLMLNEWVYNPGLPANALPPPSDAFAHVDQAVDQFKSGARASSIPFRNWTTSERLRFLNGLPRSLPKGRLDELDRAFNLSSLRNSEVLFAWLQLAIANRYDPAVPSAERFLTGMGRRKFVAPLFESFVKQGDWGRDAAARIYAKARPGYHSVTRGTVDKTLEGAGIKIQP